MTSSSSGPFLKVQDLGVTFTDEKGSLQVLNQINFSIDMEKPSF
jgi:ABC-type glutathione transport system ATPase component